MTLLQSLILGVVQGLTEFLPVSSSGHLVMAGHLMKVPPGDLSFELAVHLATTAAVVLAFRRRIWKMAKAVLAARIRIRDGRLTTSDDNLRLFLLLALATVPAGLAGYFLEEAVEQAFSSPLAASIGLLATGCILFGTRWMRGRKEQRSMDWRRALAVGLAQAVAILPGVSRSGSTIAAGIYSGVKQEKAAEFSFLLAIPVILGAGIFKLKDLAASGQPAELLPLAAGALAAATSGFLAIKWLLTLIKRNRLDCFSYYCWLAGAAGLAWSLLR